ncbi:ribonuclease H-like domain-containing protein [Tanacetum coccineum]|uniref:Ribonuclease H-like domain-containing protein n=1 Tax=Tanacetum coccineum TaxID=301880 RepID=A0ABQ4WX81_9ASTR
MCSYWIFYYKKAYKVYSLELKLVFYSRDVKYYETVFPFKKNSSLQHVEETSDNNINYLNFFDEKYYDNQNSLSPNDDGRGNDSPNDEVNVHPCTRSPYTPDVSKDDIATSMGDNSSLRAISGDVFVALLVYVDDIVIIGNNLSKIEKFKVYLKSKFQIKDLGKLKYFLGIKVLDNNDGICLSQRKYYLELLYEYDLLAAKHVD